ncbi:hypothetical protein N7466_008733 [Penicillium verhagenii]|uniref:uncharacterized protein n=1 Tax=Penicillium verhagenii TaxID=1562060 RepID=UPI0025458BA1|nr:uncharacterized protein N7466_008733 [Penicillium verhagenii]KAJ5924546.1 hypothetical protein N7466_008733 [Penicillium verhagenii]
MESNSSKQAAYNETLHKIYNSLENTLNTFGPASKQYQCVLEILKQCLRDIEDAKMKYAEPVVDPDMLSLAMGFLEIK